MAKKDYEVIARGLYVSKPLHFQEAWTEEQKHRMDQHRTTALHVALALSKGNPRFDMNKFMAACGASFDAGSV